MLSEICHLPYECPQLSQQSIYVIIVTICSTVTLTSTEEMHYVVHDLGLIYLMKTSIVTRIHDIHRFGHPTPNFVQM